MLGATSDDGAARRYDVRLPFDDTIEAATRTLLAGPLGEIVDALVGDGAELWECAALISETRAPPQAVHADTIWDAAPCLFTASSSPGGNQG